MLDGHRGLRADPEFAQCPVIHLRVRLGPGDVVAGDQHLDHTVADELADQWFDPVAGDQPR